jgi:hypothetical protein
MTVLYNGILVGIPTLISYLVSVVALGALYSAFSSAPRRRDYDGRMRPSRANSTEGLGAAFDQKNGCSRVETVGTGR